MMLGQGNRLETRVKQRIEKLYLDGVPGRLIADMCGISMSTVWRVVAKIPPDRKAVDKDTRNEAELVS